MIRAKGYFWLATRPEWVGELSQAGALSQHQAVGFWWTSVARDQWPDDPEWRQRLDRDWDPIYGDRRQELVFIGAAAEMEELDIRRGLDACLAGSATAPVLDEAAWQSLPDPFPMWERGESGEET